MKTLMLQWKGYMDICMFKASSPALFFNPSYPCMLFSALKYFDLNDINCSLKCHKQCNNIKFKRLNSTILDLPQKCLNYSPSVNPATPWSSN